VPVAAGRVRAHAGAVVRAARPVVPPPPHGVAATVAAARDAGLRPVQDPRAPARNPLALVRSRQALARNPLALVRSRQALVRNPQAAVRVPRAHVRSRRAVVPGRRAHVRSRRAAVHAPGELVRNPRALVRPAPPVAAVARARPVLAVRRVVLLLRRVAAATVALARPVARVSPAGAVGELPADAPPRAVAAAALEVAVDDDHAGEHRRVAPMCPATRRAPPAIPSSRMSCMYAPCHPDQSAARRGRVQLMHSRCNNCTRRGS
jgi:hypothetical protein